MARTTRGEATVVNIKLEGKDMPAKDLEAFLPALGINLPKGASLQGGTLSTDLNMTGRRTTRHHRHGRPLQRETHRLRSRFEMAAISMLTGSRRQGPDIEKLTSNLHMAPDGSGLTISWPLSARPTRRAGTIDSKNNLDFKMVATLANATAAPAGRTRRLAQCCWRGIGGILTQSPAPLVDVKVEHIRAFPEFMARLPIQNSFLMLAVLPQHAQVAAWLRRHFCRGSTKSLAQGQNPPTPSALSAASSKRKSREAFR